MAENFLLSGSVLIMDQQEAKEWRAMLHRQTNVTIAGSKIVVISKEDVMTALKDLAKDIANAAPPDSH